jgi:hypothetical protein
LLNVNKSFIITVKDMPMRINKNTHHTKRNIIILSAVCLLIVGGVGAWYYIQHSNAQQPGENVVDYKPATDEQKAAGDRAKQEFIARTEAEEQAKTESAASQSDDSTQAPEAVAIRITSSGMNSVYLQIRTFIQTLDASGKCTLNLSRTGSDTVTVTADTQILGSYSVCKGFDVDTTSLAKGEWNAEVKYVGSENRAGSVSKVVDVQ